MILQHQPPAQAQDEETGIQLEDGARSVRIGSTRQSIGWLSSIVGRVFRWSSLRPGPWEVQARPLITIPTTKAKLAATVKRTMQELPEMGNKNFLRTLQRQLMSAIEGSISLPSVTDSRRAVNYLMIAKQR
jgi:hypothetical protein